MSIHKILLYAFCLFFLATGFAHAVLVAIDDNYGIPASRILTVEAFGILDNDTLDGLNAGEEGVTATLHTDVSKGALACPGVGPGLCDDGSFEYTPGLGFDGFDSFQYQAVSVSTSETSPPKTVTLTACTGGPQTYTCWLEASYLAKLLELGHNNAFVESFEGVVWDVARSPGTAPGVQSKGITWTTNHPGTNEISTSSGPVRTGMWAVYDPNHGVATGTTAECDVDNPPVHCLPYDGFSGSMPGPDVLYGVGGYISGITGANVDIILDGTPHNGGKVSGPGHYFMGVIDTAGFHAFEFRELDGKVGQFLYIFGDDFIIASSGLVDANNPPVLTLLDERSVPPEPVVSPLIVNENEWFSILLTATDPNDGDSWSFSVSGAPAGSILDDNFDGTSTFSWRPDFVQAGDYPLTFTVTDNGIPAASVSEAVTITVTNVNTVTLTLAAISDVSITENTAYTSVIPVLGGGPVGVVTYSLTGADALDFSIDSATGVVSMVGRDFESPVDADSNNVYAVGITATDAGYNTASQSWTVSIIDILEVAADDDNDGIPNSNECPTGPPFDSACVDSDADGTPDYLDTDSDNDGIDDLAEGVIDTDGDGIPDYLDVDSTNNANTADGSGDSDIDGVSDATECTTGIPCPDSDQDGVPDYMDINPNVGSLTDSDIETNNVSTGGGGSSSIDLITLILFICLGLYCRNLRIRRDGLAVC